MKDGGTPIGIVHAKQASLDESNSLSPFSRFARDSWRQSVGSRPDMYKWLEAQERQQDHYRQVSRESWDWGFGIGDYRVVNMEERVG